MKINFYKYLQLALLGLLSFSTFNNVRADGATQQTAITPETLRGKIIFLRGSDVWMIDPDTRHERLILKNPFWEGTWSPSSPEIIFSPDLKRIAFTHELKGAHTGNELLSMNLDRSGKTQLTSTGWRDYAYQPRFSPNGSQIVYTHGTGYRMGGPGFTGMEIRVVNADGSNNRRVIGDIKDLKQSYFDAYWSRDGKRLLFTHYIGNIDYDMEGANQRELQTCALDGSDVQPLDGNYGAFLRPDVSPDGKFRAVLEPINPDYSKYPDLRLFTSQGQFVRELISFKPAFSKLNPHWSGDGARVAFDGMQEYTDVDEKGYARDAGSQGIWIIGRDGHNLRRLTTGALLVAWLH